MLGFGSVSSRVIEKIQKTEWHIANKARVKSSAPVEHTLRAYFGLKLLHFSGEIKIQRTLQD